MSWGSNNSRAALARAPLLQWTEGESRELISASARQTPGRGDAENRRMLLRKTAVAYGIGELLRKASRARRDPSYPPMSPDEQCIMHNFVVRTIAAGRSIEGVDMLKPRMSVNIVEPSFLGEVNDDDQEEMGRYLEVEFPSHPDADDAAIFVNQCEEDHRCHSFGVLLCELFSNCSPTAAEDTRGIRFRSSEDEPESTSNNGDAPREPARKKTQLVDLRAVSVTGIRGTNAGREMSYSALSRGAYVALLEEGLPSSICLVIQNLLDCGEDNRPDNAYDSLEEVIKDLHLLLLDPNRFLFDNEPIYDELGNPQLSFREYRLYGRENEVTSITDAFCRVSKGECESFFIGGFSGSGKSRLVNSLKARVDVSGGYVLTHKFDQMSQERQMLEVVALFNDMCLLIRDKNSQHDLLVIVNDLVQVFGADLSTLARLLPNVKALVPQLQPSDDEQERDNLVSTPAIRFMLQRFIRVVSSKAHPVVLLLDDLQWCDKSALTVVESLLCDAFGTPCVFFVGTYRSNEVAEDHEIFLLAQRLTSFGVPTTMLSLEGLNPSDLNTMISDALCIFPRISESLSDIIYQKTKGNPFFAIAFLRSLVDRRLLGYSINTRKWVWDEDDVSSMDVTGNVLYLLSSKMSELSTNIQSALKVASCFGIQIKRSVVATLGTDQEHSDILNKLEQVVKEGFMVKNGFSAYKFVHDKVQEAAYSLIPKNERNQFHYSLGMSLYSTTKGKAVDDIVFYITDQIKHGIDNLADENLELRIDIAKLNELAGMKAATCSDHVTSRSFLTFGLSLLPNDHWKSHYDLSLRFSLRLAKSCYSCGDLEKARCILGETLVQCHSLEDKLPGNLLLAKILMDRKSFIDAYTLCHEVLSQLGEEIPETLQINQMSEMAEATSKMLKSISDSDLLEMKEMDDKLSITMNFYNIIAQVAYLRKSEVLPFVTCRMVQLTMEKGLCKYSIFGFVQYAIWLCEGKIAKKDIKDASRIGKAAMSCWKKRYHTTELLPNLYLGYYGFVAFHTEPLQVCADMLRQGFDAGMSLGETGAAFFNSGHHIRNALMAGDRLPTLLEKVDYYLKLTNTYQNETAKASFSLLLETISILMGKGGNAIDVPDAASEHFLSVIHFHRAMQAHWQGHSERCQHYIKKLLLSKTVDIWRLLFITFIDGMNSFQLLKRTSNGKLRSIPRNAIIVLKNAASLSSWNFLNKVHLLEAEQFSLQNHNSEAQASYAAAINSARSSGFIHEQGLACELAGHHYKKVFDLRSAWSFFDQAKRCYAEWGSQLKVDSVTQQLDSLSDYAPGGPSPSRSSSLSCPVAGNGARVETHHPSSRKKGNQGGGGGGMDDETIRVATGMGEQSSGNSDTFKASLT